MRLPRMRFAVGRLMALVSAIGIAIRLLMAAWEASPDFVYHIRRYEDTGKYTMRSHRLLAADEIHDMTYGSRFWHCVLGIPLAGDPCRCKAHFEMVEGRRTTDVRTTFDRSLGNAFLDWFAANPKKLPRPTRSCGRRRPAIRPTAA